MIKNNKQLANTKKQLKELINLISTSESQSAGNQEDILQNLENSAIKSLCSSLQKEISEYEAIKSEDSILFKNISISEIPKILIYARLAEGISQKELAVRIESQQQQINRYESTDFESANFSKIVDILEALNVEIDLTVNLRKVKVSQISDYESAPIGNVSAQQIKEFQEKVVLEKRLLRA